MMEMGQLFDASCQREDLGRISYSRSFLHQLVLFHSIGKSNGFSHRIENFTGGTYPGVKG